MSIRKTLLIAFLGVTLVSTLLLASLAFIKAREAVRAEIERNLVVQASSTAAEIDKMMFERLQNAATWSHLDIMQDLQVRDVDKRLSRFLEDLHTGYQDVYVNLTCLDNTSRVISSSDAKLVYRLLSDPSPWVKTQVAGSNITLNLPSSEKSASLVMRVPVESSFTAGRLGVLRLQLDWSKFFEVLDQAARGNGRMLAILDRDGRLIAASAALRERGLYLGQSLASWRSLQGEVQTHAGSPVAASDVIVGGAASHGYANFAGFGWTTLVIQPVDLAFAPVRHMAVIFLGLLGFIAAVSIVLASWVSREIARPITTLTEFTRRYPHHQGLTAPLAHGGEVGELTEAFAKMVRDIEQSQQNLVRASKLAVVGEMSSVIAHEVRTPLGILRSSAQMLQRETGISDEGRELLGFIASETERLNSLVSAMLDTARPRAISYKMVNMHELIHKCIAMLSAQASRKGIVISEHLVASHPTIECDEEQMTQVVLNLLMNGLQILQHEGRIDVSSRHEGDRICIDIADDGPGIDPSERARVFEAFFFKREGGIGLGLAIVQQIVQAHAGQIEAEESPIGGALFRISLPLVQQTGQS